MQDACNCETNSKRGFVGSKQFLASQNVPRLRNRSRATMWCKFCGPQLQKVLRTCQFLMNLTSKSFSRHRVAQILRTSTSKSALNMPVFNDFYFETTLAPQRGANFDNILGSRSSAPPSFSELTFRACKTTNL